MINRNIFKPVPAFTAVSTVFTCSTGDTLNGVAINGQIIDRLGLGGSTYNNQVSKSDRALVGGPFAFAWTTAGSTQANKQVMIDCKLQHGDSSGGGDMANLSTQDDAVTRIYFSTAESTEFLRWSTGPMQMHSNVSDYYLDATKRYIRPVTTITKGFNATSTAAGSVDLLYVVQGINLGEFTYTPPSVLSGTTATSTA
jgi:hypothetical protein